MADKNTGDLTNAQLAQAFVQLQRMGAFGGGNFGGIGALGGLQGQPRPGSASARQQLLGQPGARDFGTGVATLGADGRRQQFFPDPLTGQVPGASNFAPTTQFTGGSPFEVKDTAQILQNLFVLLGGAEGLEKGVKGAGQFLGDVGSGIGSGLSEIGKFLTGAGFSF